MEQTHGYNTTENQRLVVNCASENYANEGRWFGDEKQKVVWLTEWKIERVRRVTLSVTVNSASLLLGFVVNWKDILACDPTLPGLGSAPNKTNNLHSLRRHSLRIDCQ